MTSGEDEWIEELQGPNPRASETKDEPPATNDPEPPKKSHRFGDFRVPPETSIKGFSSFLS